MLVGGDEKLKGHLRVLVRKASRVVLLIAGLFPFLFRLAGCLGEWEALRFLLGAVVVFVVVVAIGFSWEINFILSPTEVSGVSAVPGVSAVSVVLAVPRVSGAGPRAWAPVWSLRWVGRLGENRRVLCQLMLRLMMIAPCFPRSGTDRRCIYRLMSSCLASEPCLSSRGNRLCRRRHRQGGVRL